MTAKLPNYWPEGSAYQTPREPVAMFPICPACGARHQGPTPSCNLNNDPQETDLGDPTD